MRGTALAVLPDQPPAPAARHEARAGPVVQPLTQFVGLMLQADVAEDSIREASRYSIARVPSSILPLTHLGLQYNALGFG